MNLIHVRVEQLPLEPMQKFLDFLTCLFKNLMLKFVGLGVRGELRGFCSLFLLRLIVDRQVVEAGVMDGFGGGGRRSGVVSAGVRRKNCLGFEKMKRKRNVP